GLCFTPDGRGLVTGSPSDLIVCDVTGTPQPVRRFHPPVYAGPVVVSPCGRFIANWISGVRVYELTATGERPVTELTGRVASLAVAFSPDGTELAEAGQTPRLWAVPSWTLIRSEQPKSHVSGDPYCTGAIAYSPDGGTIALSFAVMNDSRTRYDECI